MEFQPSHFRLPTYIHRYCLDRSQIDRLSGHWQFRPCRVFSFKQFAHLKTHENLALLLQDLIYWIMFAVGILVEILGICLVGYARGKRNAILRRCHSPVLCPTVVVGPNQQRYVLPPGAPPGYLTTANLPPAYNTQYGFIPSAPQGQSK